MGNGSVWCYGLKKHFVRTVPKQRWSSASPVLTVVPHLLAWLVALGFSRKCQELTSECLMPHLLTRKYSFFTHTYRKVMFSSCHILEVFLRKTSQVLEERQQQRHFPKMVFTWNIFHLSLSVLSPWTSHLSFTKIFSGNSTTTKCLHLTTTLTSCSRI